jgi:hypothetical protein
LPEVFDVVIDGVEAVPAGLDEEVVDRHVECACPGGPSQSAGSYFVDDGRRRARRADSSVGWSETAIVSLTSKVRAATLAGARVAPRYVFARLLNLQGEALSAKIN